MAHSESADHFDFQTYGNGLRLITVPMEHTKSVTVLVLVATGSRYENKDINGISHFLEHMMFKGTDKRPKSATITEELDSIGAEYNAFTSKEYTGYYVKCAAEKVDIALDVIADIFQNSKLAADEIEKERGVIIEEINMYLDTPSRYVGEVFESLLYGDQPLGYEIVGPKEVIRKLSRDDFLNYFETHYFDKNTVIAIAGAVEPDQIKTKIEKYFSNIRDNQLITPLKAQESQTKPALKIVNKKTDQTHFVLGFRAYHYFTEKSRAVDVMSLILSGGMSSRLFQEFRDKRGLSYYVRASNNPYADVGYFDISAGVDNARVTQALELTINECKKLVAEQVSETELKKVKDFAHGKLAIGLETSSDLASFYADQELLKKEILTPEIKLAQIDKITAADIQAVAQEIFRPERLNLAMIGPFTETDPAINKIISSW